MTESREKGYFDTQKLIIGEENIFGIGTKVLVYVKKLVLKHSLLTLFFFALLEIGAVTHKLQASPQNLLSFPYTFCKGLTNIR
jgi:hypothetical protein